MLCLSRQNIDKVKYNLLKNGTNIDALSYRYAGSKNDPRQMKILRWLYNYKVNKTGYGILVGKYNQSEIYCSGLVWQAYKYFYHVDLDRDGGWFVWPNDIRYSKYVHKWNSQNR